MRIPYKQLGLSLIELMVALALSSLLIIGVLQIFLSSKQTYMTNNSLSQLQEIGRFSLDFMTEDIRNAGYKGECLGFPTNHTSDGVGGVLWTLDEPVRGWESVEPNHVDRTVLANTDSISVQFAAGDQVELNGTAANGVGVNTLSLDADHGVSQNTITLVSEALGCDLFVHTGTASNQLAKGDATDWSIDYSDQVEVMTLRSVTYFVANNDDGVPALYSQRLIAGPDWDESEELVTGVESMQLLYGIAGANEQVSSYVTADAVTNWGSVSAVQVELTALSDEGIRQTFTSTIGIRNRLP
ncbi:MAG: PilW family protein [Halopseudomonas sabulinigri]